jgi:4'-phosphopantetheinyl transferase
LDDGPLTAGTIHVWTIDLDAAAARVPSLLRLLSGEERARAARLRTTELRLRFVVAHGALRLILARYLNVEPAAIRVETTTFGKPFVADSSMSFNLSHSDGLAVCALTTNAQVGIDVERIRPVTDADGIATRYFAAGEARQYASFARTDRPAAFFSTWTRKEAFLKATGLGLQRALDSFEVEVAPEATAPWLVLNSSTETTEHWHLRSFEPRPEYVAAVALDREIRELEFFDWAAETARSAVDPRESREFRSS